MRESVKDELLYNKWDWYKAKICDTRYIGLDCDDYAKIEFALGTNKKNKEEIDIDDIREK